MFNDMKINMYRGTCDTEKAVTDMIANHIKNILFDTVCKHHSNIDKKFKYYEMEHFIHIEDFDCDLYNEIDKYLNNPKIKMNRKLSRSINKECDRIAATIIFKNIGTFLKIFSIGNLSDIEIDSIMYTHWLSLPNNDYCISNFKRLITTTRHSLSKGFERYDFTKPGITIIEIYSLIEKYTKDNLLKITRLSYYKLYCDIIDNMIPMLGFRGIGNNNIIYFIIVIKKLAYTLKLNMYHESVPHYIRKNSNYNKHGVGINEITKLNKEEFYEILEDYKKYWKVD